MSMAHRDRLRAIRTFPQLVKYLRDDLKWPIESDHFDEIVFEYMPEDLGLDAKVAANIQEIKQLRPLVTDQPWGIFFVKFEPKRLPVVALRRILSRLVFRKRASANKPELPHWRLHDLLFISAYGEDEHRQISFAHFADTCDLPTLKVLGWDQEDTALHLDHAHATLQAKLCWNEGEPVETWRERWSSAFELFHREVITTSKKLAERLAVLARDIRKCVNAALRSESDKGPRRRLMLAFKEALIHDLSDDDFADMYAQTIAYGLLTARIARHSPDDNEGTIVADNLVDMVPITNPFLKELLETFLHVGGRRNGGKTGAIAIDFDELGINDVVEMLRMANMKAVLREFGNRNPQEDPVIHFYERFLKEYDAKRRMDRGVFYTPRPVVSYIVRSVHELLQTEFGLKDGLADTTTWGEMLKKHKGLKLPEFEVVDSKTRKVSKKPINPNTPFVQILDPATGTATFLVEVIDVIYETMVAKWKIEGHAKESDTRKLWNKYVPRNLLPRLHGYELMMAPYAIAHMKIGLKLFETGYQFASDERTRVFLTNALEPPRHLQMTFAVPALTHEADAVNEIKRQQPITVVIGNPPYSVSSWNKGQWITELVEDYKRSVRQEESQIQALSNDYIKFLRLAEWQISKAGSGIQGMITGHGYLHGTQPRDLRNHLSRTFEHCRCLDLHGSIRRAGTDDRDDEPVFEIMTGVAVIIASAITITGSRGVTTCCSLTGRAKAKFAHLAKQTASNTAKQPPHTPLPPNFYFSPEATPSDVASEYRAWFDLPEVFGTGDRRSDKEIRWATGFASQQDDLAISFTRAEVTKKMEALAESGTFKELRKTYRLCKTNQWDYDKARQFARGGDWQNYVKQVTYRPFDRRWTVLHRHVLTILRKHVMSQLGGRSADGIGLVSSRAVNDLIFAHCFVTDEPVDKIFISSKTSTNAYVFPLFVSESGLHGQKRYANFSLKFQDSLSFALSTTSLADKSRAEVFAPLDVFHYIYATLHSPSYRNRYAEFLKIDFPRIPLPGSARLFEGLVRFGSELVGLHLMRSVHLVGSEPTYTGPQAPKVEKASYSADTVWLDKAQTYGFKGIPEDVWNFHIGGYQVCHKWLKDRKGRTLSKADITHYQKIVVSLNETIRLMGEIDKVIDKHGGWPGAFITDAERLKALKSPKG